MSSEKSETMLRMFGISNWNCLATNKLINESSTEFYSGSPLRLAVFYERSAENIDELLNDKPIREFFKKIEKIEKEYYNLLTEDDKEILDFLSKNTNLPAEGFFAAVNPLLFTFNVMKNLENRKIDSAYMAGVFQSYVQIYELCLFHIDRRLREYLIKIGKDNWPKGIYSNTRKIDHFFGRKGTDHESATFLIKILSLLLHEDNLDTSMNSNSRTSFIRHKISHAGVSYDEETEILILSGNEICHLEELITELKRIFIFLLEWLNLMVSKNKTDEVVNVDRLIEDSVKQIKDEAKARFITYSKTLREMENTPKQKTRYSKLIRKLEKEGISLYENQFFFDENERLSIVNKPKYSVH
jgi:hypothetical protein